MPLHVDARGLGSDDDACTCVVRTWRRCGDRRGRRTRTLASVFRDVQQETRSRIAPIRLDAHPHRVQERERKDGSFAGGRVRFHPSHEVVFSRLSPPMPRPYVISTRAHVARRTCARHEPRARRGPFLLFTTLSSQPMVSQRSLHNPWFHNPWFHNAWFHNLGFTTLVSRRRVEGCKERMVHVVVVSHVAYLCRSGEEAVSHAMEGRWRSSKPRCHAEETDLPSMHATMVPTRAMSHAIQPYAMSSHKTHSMNRAIHPCHFHGPCRATHSSWNASC